MNTIRPDYNIMLLHVSDVCCFGAIFNNVSSTLPSTVSREEGRKTVVGLPEWVEAN